MFSINAPNIQSEIVIAVDDFLVQTELTCSSNESSENKLKLKELVGLGASSRKHLGTGLLFFWVHVTY